MRLTQGVSLQQYAGTGTGRTRRPHEHAEVIVPLR